MRLHILRSCSSHVSPFLFLDFFSGVPLFSNVISIFFLSVWLRVRRVGYDGPAASQSDYCEIA
jgi:hypothetical protein